LNPFLDGSTTGAAWVIAVTDAKEIYETRLQVVDGAFRKAMAQQFSLLRKQ
jgi:hypothetical protein